MIGQHNQHHETRAIARGLVVLTVLGLEFGFEHPSRAATLEPPGPSTPGGSPVISVIADERLFTLFAALNVAGYDREINPDGMSETRLAVRAALADRPLAILPVLRLYRGMCQEVRISRCAMYVLHLGPAPDFARVVRGWFVDAPEHDFLGFDWALREFHREANITSLWQQHRPAYQRAVAAYAAVAAPLAEAALRYTRMPPIQARHLVVIPNLLDTGWVGYGPQIGDTAYVILGPSAEVETGLLQHELLHSAVNPAIFAALASLDSTARARLEEQISAVVGRQDYRALEGVVCESVIRALEIRLAPEDAREGLLAEEDGDGFVLVRPLFIGLADYEQTMGTFGDYVPALLQSLIAT